MGNVIPVVFSANDAYVYYCYTSIFSLKEHKSSNYHYRIFVLVTNMSNENIGRLENLSEGNITVRCIDIKSTIHQINLKGIGNLSVETYYRLFIPLILPEYEKVIYLDSDLLVLADIAELFLFDLKNRPIGAIRDVKSKKAFRKHYEMIGGLDYRQVFNAGVLLINTRIFEEEEIRNKCLKILTDDFKRERRLLTYADQDALNIVLRENIAWIDGRWNFGIQFAYQIENIDEEERKNYTEMMDEAAILHFAGDQKPWLYPMNPKADFYWDTVTRTPYLRETVDFALKESANRTRKEFEKSVKEYLFPYEQVPFGVKVVIYGAGIIGRQFVKQLTYGKYAEIVLWCDQEWEKDDLRQAGVSNPAGICEKNYDCIVIAMKSKDVFLEVRDYLKKLRVPAETIIWQEYKRK